MCTAHADYGHASVQKHLPADVSNPLSMCMHTTRMLPQLFVASCSAQVPSLKLPLCQLQRNWGVAFVPCWHFDRHPGPSCPCQILKPHCPCYEGGCSQAPHAFCQYASAHKPHCSVTDQGVPLCLGTPLPSQQGMVAAAAALTVAEGLAWGQPAVSEGLGSYLAESCWVEAAEGELAWGIEHSCCREPLVGGVHFDLQVPECASAVDKQMISAP